MFAPTYFPVGADVVAAAPGTALLRFVPAHGALLRFLPAAKPED